MTIITLTFPLGVLPSGMVPNIWMQESESWIVYGVFWAFDTGSSYQPFGYVTYAILFLLLPVCVFNILYIRQIMRYYYGRSSRDSAISCGLISVLLPTLIGMAVNGFYLPDGGFLFAGAVPIQFVAGLIILYKIPGPELISPWQGVFLDGSWWTRRKNKAPDWFNDVFALWEEYVDLERVDE